MRPDRREFLTLGIGALAVASLPNALRGRPALVRRRTPVMGTVAEVAVPSHDPRWAHRAIDAAFTELRRVEHTMSRFRADSDVGRLNAGAGEWTSVSEDTGRVLQEAARWASLSGGRFDPCLGRASELWDVTNRHEPPEGAEVRPFAHASLSATLEIDRGSTTPRARLQSPLAAVDLGGIAKGFAVDAAAAALREYGVFNGLVNVGGDLVALGSDAAGDPWYIGVRAPNDPASLATTFSVADEAVATSGDYVRFFQHGGRRYHHLLDPESGTPYRTRTRSLTVRANRAIDADAGATALFAAPTRLANRVLARASNDVSIIHHIQEVIP